MAFKPKTIKERSLHRLKIARGHLDKVIRMVETDSYCIDTIHQSRAVQQALKEVDSIILENHMQGCVADAVQGGRKDEAIAEVMNVFRKTR